MPIRSFTAPRIRCQPRYRSVVWTETWSSRNWIWSNSPPAAWHNFAQERLLCRMRHNRRCNMRIAMQEPLDRGFVQLMQIQLHRLEPVAEPGDHIHLHRNRRGQEAL